MTSQFFISDCNNKGFPNVIYCKCGEIFTAQGYASHKRGCHRGIRN